MDCFRCNRCGTLLDSDANLLLLGDGSLICNNCTYSCTACGNKIEDLAILTGDQAFCATCFRCRNCKRKIENLRYARTSQGIFCMSCHESLMARRKKRSRANQAKSREKDTPPMSTEKSLPALPPSAIPPGAFSSEPVDQESDNPTELSPRPRQAYNQNGSSRGTPKSSRSPERPAADTAQKDSLSIPNNNYRNNRNSHVFMPSDSGSRDSEAFFIPLALDPSPVISPDPRSTSDTRSTNNDKDYFGSVKPSSPEAKVDSQASTPHIAFQEKPRQSEQDSSKVRHPTRKSSKSNRSGPSGTAHKPAISPDDRPPRTSSRASPANEDFRLQDAPRGKKPQPSRTSSLSSSGRESAPAANTAAAPSGRNDSLQVHTDSSGVRRSSQDSRKPSGEAIRDRSDSLRHDAASPPSTKPIVRKEVPQQTSRSGELAPCFLSIRAS